MKLRFTILIFSVLLFSIDRLKSQSYNSNLQVLPLKSTNSVLFGKDIIIDDQPQQDQKAVTVCSALNGWLYAAFSYNNTDNQTSFRILKSTDNGIHWLQLYDETVGLYNVVIPKIELMACGTNDNDIKIFLGILTYDTVYNSKGVSVLRINGTTGLFEALIGGAGYPNDFALANDNLYPSVNSNPYSIAALYSKAGTLDSLILETSSNGGISFDHREIVALEPLYSPNMINKVALAYGRCPSKNSGRYFAAWEEQDHYSTSTVGHIYTAHSEPNFNSPFTTPICLDSLEPTTINMLNNPVISCQYNNIDNDSSNLSEIVLFRKYLPATQTYDLKGFYNLKAATSNYFNEFSISSSSNKRIEPDICFNPYNSTFMLTFFDSTELKLPFLNNNVNMTNPNSWNVTTQAYNDSPYIVSPYPKVKLNYGQQEGMNAWISKGTNGKGVAMFDAPYSTYTGIPGNNTSNNDRLLGAYPNPCKDIANIGFEVKNPEKVNIILYDLYGQSVEILTDQYFSSGKQNVRIDVSGFPSGTYIYKFQTSACIASGRFVIAK